MSLLGCEWESIERYEKLCGVVSQCGKSKLHFLHRAHDDKESRSHRIVSDECYTLQCMQTYIFGHDLPKTMFKGVI